MDNNLVGRWVFPTMGALTALYIYNTMFDNVNNINTDVVKNEDIKKVNEGILSDASSVKHVDIVKRDMSTAITTSFLKESDNTLEHEDYEDVTNSTINDMSKMVDSKPRRWWY
tara:strand:- start:685 stop:1023 length:339 start_codon:yes stop_codon:yes gene_type:complete